VLDAGRILIELGVRDGKVADVQVRSQRPQVTAALRGKAAADAVRLVPLLYALCGKAQGHAARLALAAAQGAETLPHLHCEIQQEVMREHLWRLLVDLPPLVGRESLRTACVAAIKALLANDRAGVADVLDGVPFEELLAMLGQVSPPRPADVALLPALSASESRDTWTDLDQSLAATPLWRNRPAETGAHARQHGGNDSSVHPYLARWQARLAELQLWIREEAKVGAGGTASAVAISGRRGGPAGRSLIETARGLLMHEIELNGDAVSHYVIVAPTEWNFHPQGVLFHWLTGVDAMDEADLRQWTAHAVAALDPCVSWELIIRREG
jgi:hypothetical protein